MIRYKVVRLDFGNRHSCYATGKYRLAYRKNTIVTAKKGTLGIAVFERRYQAENFLHNEFSSDRGCEIIRVIPIGRGKRYRFVCESQDAMNLNIFYHRYRSNLNVFLRKIPPQLHSMSSPIGTIFYQQVKVLE